MNKTQEERGKALVQELLRGELDEGEALLWSDQPEPRHMFRRALPTAVGFSCLILFVGGMSLTAAVSTWLELQGLEPLLDRSNPKPSLDVVYTFGLFGIGILGILLWSARLPWIEAGKARRTMYGVTKTRVIVVRQGRGRQAKVEAMEPGHPLHLLREELASGRGSVHLYPQNTKDFVVQAKLTLHSVADARGVERLLRKTFDP